MKLIKWIFSKFSALEVIVLMISITISTFLIIPVFTPQAKVEGAQIIMPTVDVYNVEGGRPVPLFDTYFFIKYEETSKRELDAVKNAVNDYLVPYHKLFDRHNDYYAVDPVNPKFPTAEEKATLPRLINLKYINEHQGEELEIDKPLYDLLVKAKEYSKQTTNNAFNMFIGGLYDFWKPIINTYNAGQDPLNNEEQRAKLEELVSYIPLSNEDIDNTLVLRNIDNKYYVTFNEFNNSGLKLSISVGAVAKGMMTDILKDTLVSKGLTKGLINGGTSSFTFLDKGFYGKPLVIKMASINEANSAFEFSRFDKYQMSTSGIYEGFFFKHGDQEIIRSHIVNPKTGYPAQQTHQAVNIASSTLSGLELDYLTTTLTVLTLEEGLTFLKNNYASHDLNVVYVGKDNNGYFVAHTANYPGGNEPHLTVNSTYREIFLDLL